MRRFSNLLPIFAIILVAVLCGLLVGWWSSRKPAEDLAIAPLTAEKNLSVAESNILAEPTVAVEKTNEIPEIAPAEQPVTAENWEERLDDILGDQNLEESKKADKIADMIPKLPEVAQVELAGHLVNLVPDEEYAKTAAILKNDAIPESVSSVIMDDLFNRDDELRLPLFLEIAKNEKHPLHTEALENLEMSLQEEFGTNWEKWNEAIETSLKEQSQ